MKPSNKSTPAASSRFFQSNQKQREGPVEIPGLARYVRGKELYVLLFLVLSISIVVYKDFLFLNKVYLFKDIGSDTLDMFYPLYVHVSDYLRDEGLPRWTFNVGMGQNFFPFSFRDPFTVILFLLGQRKHCIWDRLC